jgi:hypothetical protein
VLDVELLVAFNSKLSTSFQAVYPIVFSFNVLFGKELVINDVLFIYV